MQNAEHRYSQEIIAHADSMKALEGLKKELAKARASLRDQRTTAETAEAKLSSSETSWKQQKEALEKENADLNTR
jgi:nucleoprotein TPR